MRRVIAPLAALMLLLVFPAVSPGASPRPESRARAWAVKVAMAGDTLQVVQMAEVASQSGASMAATGAPLSIGGQDLVRASASQTARDDVKTQMNYTDSTGSTTFEGGFAEAHVSESSSTSRAGFGSNVTSGLPMASMLMTWEQQEQAMNTWISLNEPIFGPLNAQMEALAPVLERQGLVPPHFEYLQPLGFVDVVKSRQVAATSETVSTEGYSSASASVTLSEIRLFAGFIEARGVSAEASSEGTDAAGSKSATARIEGLKIAGIDCVADSKGVHAANNDALAKAMIQPTLDAIVGALRSAGVTLRAIDSYGEKDLREASALEIDIASPAGNLLISIGHAEASAASVGGAASATETGTVPAAGSYEPAPAGSDVLPGYIESPVGDDGSYSGVPSSISSADSQTRRVVAGPRVLPASTARSVRTAYLLLVVVGGLAGALILPMLARPAPRRRT